jgi:hypothetical protein
MDKNVTAAFEEAAIELARSEPGNTRTFMKKKKKKHCSLM